MSGLPGVGKTQAALEYAYRYGDQYQAVLWMTAQTREALVTGFSRIACLLDLPVKNDPNPNVVLFAVQRWLQDHGDWLLVLDNVEDLALAGEYLPASGQGHVLITTREFAPGGLAERLEVEALPVQEGACLLLQRAKLLDDPSGWGSVPEEDQQAALIVSRLVGGLPLALEQAGAFIEATPSTPAEYLDYYQKEGAALRGPLRTTFALAFRKVAEANPAASDLLRLCAFLAPDIIPEEVVSNGSPDLGEALGAAVSQLYSWSETTRAACRYSLLDRDPRARTFTIHRVVQAVLQDEMVPGTQKLWAERAVRAVSRTFPTPEFSNWSDCGRLIAQAQTCADLVDRWNFEFPAAARLLNNGATCLRNRGQYAAAEPLFQRALVIAKTALGPSHAEVAGILNGLAVLYRRQGRYTQAEPLFCEALAMREQTLGSEHPDVAASLNNLGNLYHDLSRYPESELSHQRALSIRERVRGPEHPEVATSLSNLAILRRDQGEWAQAEKLYLRALSIREHALGPDHPEVAANLNSLAILFHSQGHFEAAEPLYQRALAIWEKALGPDHPDLASSLNNLAELLRDRGQYEAAEPRYRRALTIWQQALGATHRHVAEPLHGLAEMYSRQGRYAEAEPLLQQALAIREKALGPEHPDVAETLNCLALFYRERDQQAAAVPLYHRALAIWEKRGSPEHAAFATSLNNLAELFLEQGDLLSARPLLCKALEIREKVLLPEHADTRKTRELLSQISEGHPDSPSGRSVSTGTRHAHV